MSLLVDAWLWLWLRGGVAITRFVSPAHAEELDRRLRLDSLHSSALQPAGTATATTTTSSSQPNTAGATSTAPRRLTSDLVQDDQDTGLCRHASVSTTYQSAGSAASSLDLGDSANRPSGGAPMVPTHGSSAEDLREMQMRLEDLRATTPEMKNMMGQLLRTNEDNAVLKSALLATLAKLQATRDELQNTRAELHLTQEQAQLLAEERESACFSLARISNIPEETEEEVNSADAPSMEVQRSLDTLLAALQDLRTTVNVTDDSVGCRTPTAAHAMSPTRSHELPASYSMPSEDSHGRFCSSSPMSPSSDVGSAAARSSKQQPTVHLKGVGYRVALHMSASPTAMAAATGDRCSA